MNYGPMTQIYGILKGYEKFFENGRAVDELTDMGRERNLHQLNKEVVTAMSHTMSYQYWILNPLYILAFHKLGLWILKFINYVDTKCPELFYFIPEFYINICFDILRLLLRVNIKDKHIWGNKKIPSHSFPSEEYIKEFITLVTNHICDSDITNPDLHDSFLTKLNLILQYKHLIPMLEDNKTAQEKLVKRIMQCFEKNDLGKLAKNFLRIFKGNGFNEIKYGVLPECPSSYFKQQLKEYLMANTEKCSHFINMLTIKFHNAISELKLSFEESHNVMVPFQQRSQLSKESKYFYLTSLHMMKVLEASSQNRKWLFQELQIFAWPS
eukprot:TRINITY_DN18227_c0_g2_i1.p1 TRINITY_DN18227_c0_g2~~TRINITY_DN18227_c0_g2_i1.p1  ORF type:complete len:325 (+),score=23.74 TRINITY_DN18227_c0_g2_i1:1-975(+)